MTSYKLKYVIGNITTKLLMLPPQALSHTKWQNPRHSDFIKFGDYLIFDKNRLIRVRFCNSAQYWTECTVSKIPIPYQAVSIYSYLLLSTPDCTHFGMYG